MVNDNVYDNALMELRRGIILLAVLSELRQEGYGYSVLRALSQKGMDIEQGTLYPLLRRLESQGLLESAWRVEDERPRRYYRTSPAGIDLLERLTIEWKRMVETIDQMLPGIGEQNGK
ncbi:MAG: PadR family transcriptional regulator [Anaerolineae bacterium]|jgi:DNA-binding PadR family transcriptional regulator|nr:PadR family transcriptional regulator [Anaerolineae bacterium]